MAPFSPPAAVRPNTAPASSARSRRAGCGGTNPGPTSNSPAPAPSYSPDGSDALEASLHLVHSLDRVPARRWGCAPGGGRLLAQPDPAPGQLMAIYRLVAI